MEQKKMYLLSYDHGGYVLWGDKVEDRLHLVTRWLEKYSKFKIGLDYEAFTFDEMEHAAPQINRIVAELLEKYPDRVGLGSTTYGQPLSLFVSEESNVRQLTYAIRANLRHFGQTPDVYAISEFALNNQHPQLLKLCGYAGALMRTHVMNYGYQKSFDSSYGIWQGKDGTQIPAIPTYLTAGEGYTNTTLDNWVLTRWPGDSVYSPEDFEARFFKYEPLLASRYDDISNGKEELIAHVQEKDAYSFVLLEDLMEIYGAPTEILPTDDNDFHGRMPWGYCGNEIFNAVRQTEVNAALAERLNAISVLHGGKPMQETLETAWKNALVLQHHDVTICGLLDEAHRFAPDSLRASDAVIQASMAHLSGVFTTETGAGVLVCNCNDFTVRDWVNLSADCAVVYDGDQPLPTEWNDGKLKFFAEMPPFSVRTFSLRSAENPQALTIIYDARSGILTTPFYRISLSANGICYIENVQTGRRIADNGEGALFAGVIDDSEETSIGEWSVQVGTHSVTAVFTGKVGSIPCRFTMRLNDQTARIDCGTSFDLHGEHVGKTGITKGIHTDYVVNGSVHENKLRFVINLCLNKERKMVRDLPFAIAEWDDQIPEPEDFWYKGKKVLVDHKVPHDVCFVTPCYLQGVYWLALRDKTQGFAVFNRGCIGSVVEGNTLGIPLVYANDYMCGTRMLNGTYTSEFALFAFDAEMQDVQVHKQALQYEYPLIAAVTQQGNGLAQSFRLHTQSAPEPVLLTALYPEDGAIYARFCNYSDAPQTLDLQPTIGRLQAETDLLCKDLRITDGSLLQFHPWEIKTVRLIIQ